MKVSKESFGFQWNMHEYFSTICFLNHFFHLYLKKYIFKHPQRPLLKQWLHFFFFVIKKFVTQILLCISL